MTDDVEREDSPKVGDEGETFDLAVFEGIDDDADNDGDSDAGLESKTEVDDTDSAGAATDKPETETEAGEAAKTASPVEEPVTEPKVAAPPAAEEPGEVEKEAPATAAPASPTIEDVAKQFQDWRSDAEKILAEQHYRLSEEQVEELETSPATAIPKIVARAYVDVVATVMSQVASTLPRMMEIAETQKGQKSQFEESFYSQWEALRSHEDTVIRIGQAFRQANPNASSAEFIREVGAASMVALQLPLPGVTDQPEEKAPPAFKPAAGERRVAAPKTGGSNPFEQLAESVLREDMDFN